MNIEQTSENILTSISRFSLKINYGPLYGPLYLKLYDEDPSFFTCFGFWYYD